MGRLAVSDNVGVAAIGMQHMANFARGGIQKDGGVQITQYIRKRLRHVRRWCIARRADVTLQASHPEVGRSLKTPDIALLRLGLCQTSPQSKQAGGSNA